MKEGQRRSRHMFELGGTYTVEKSIASAEVERKRLMTPVCLHLSRGAKRFTAWYHPDLRTKSLHALSMANACKGIELKDAVLLRHTFSLPA